MRQANKNTAQRFLLHYITANKTFTVREKLRLEKTVAGDLLSPQPKGGLALSDLFTPTFQ